MFKNMAEKFMGRMFRRVDNAVWDLQTGKIGIQTTDGIVTLETSEPVDGADVEYSISINIMDDFGMAIPAFAQSTPIESIKNGDLIYSTSKVLGYVIKKTGSSFRILKLDGQQGTWTPPKVTMIGLSDAGGVLVLRSLFNSLPGGESGMAGLQGMLMPLIMMGGDNLDLESMLPMILMSQNGMMGGAAGGNGNMIQMMMMMNMMKGEGNPMKNMFGGTSSAKTGTNHFGRGH